MYGQPVPSARVKHPAAAMGLSAVLPPLGDRAWFAPTAPELEVVPIERPLSADELAVRPAEDSGDHPVG